MMGVAVCFVLMCMRPERGEMSMEYVLECVCIGVDERMVASYNGRGCSDSC